MRNNIRNKLILGSILLLLVSSLAVAQDRWLHVRVQEHGNSDATVNVNIPLSLIEALLPTIETDEFDGGVILLDDVDFEGVDLREALVALRDAPDAEFVTIQSRDETVRVAKEDGFLLVNADEDRGDRVRVRMPLSVVDAMLSPSGDRIDLIAGLRALSEFDGGDLVTVESDDETVRVWIDSSDTGD
jgi:hypothetical protein